MKIAEYKQMMEYLTRPGFNGGGSVRNKTVLPKKKPEEEVKKRKIKNFEKAKPALENPKEVKEMIDKPKRGLVDEPGSYAGKSAAERMREYRLKNPRPFKVTEIVADGVKYNIPNNAMKPESAKGFIKFLNKLEKDSSLENYRKLIAKESKPIQRVIRSYRAYLQNEKAGAFATGEGENLRKLFDELKLPNKSKNFLSKVTSKDIKGQIVQTATKAAGEAAKGTSMDVVNAVRDIFVNDPNNAPSLDEVAEGLEGTKKFNAASASEKIKMRTRASNGVAQFLQAITADRKVKGFKDIAPETLGEIVQYIDDNKRGQFRFAEGLIRDYKIKLRDSLIKGDFGKQRRNIPGQKGKVIDEVFGLSATFENAPGYTENIQIISNEANKLKRTQIDKPFAAILKAIKNGRDTVTFDKQKNVPISEAIKKFNTRSKVFSNVNKISTPQIFVGDNLDPTKLVSNFDQYSLGAQKNIKELAKQGFVFNATKPSTPIGTFNNKNLVETKPGRDILGKTLKGAGTVLKGAGTVLNKGVLGPLTALEAPSLAFPQSAFQLGNLIGDVKRGEETDASAIGITAPTSLAYTAASKQGLDLFADKAGFIKKALRAGVPFNSTLKNIARLSKGSVFATPFIETGIQAYNAKKRLEEAKKKSSVFEPTVNTLLGEAPESYYNEIMSEIPSEGRLKEFPIPFTDKKFTLPEVGVGEFAAAGGGIAKLAGKPSGPAPESGPTPQGLDFLMKRGR